MSTGPQLLQRQRQQQEAGGRRTEKSLPPTGSRGSRASHWSFLAGSGGSRWATSRTTTTATSSSAELPLLWESESNGDNTVIGGIGDGTIRGSASPAPDFGHAAAAAAATTAMQTDRPLPVPVDSANSFHPASMAMEFTSSPLVRDGDMLFGFVPDDEGTAHYRHEQPLDLWGGRGGGGDWDSITSTVVEDPRGLSLLADAHGYDVGPFATSRDGRT